MVSVFQSVALCVCAHVGVRLQVGVLQGGLARENALPCLGDGFLSNSLPFGSQQSVMSYGKQFEILPAVLLAEQI